MTQNLSNHQNGTEIVPIFCYVRADAIMFREHRIMCLKHSLTNVNHRRHDYYYGLGHRFSELELVCCRDGQEQGANLIN